jgi:hypothetical protein
MYNMLLAVLNMICTHESSYCMYVDSCETAIHYTYQQNILG